MILLRLNIISYFLIVKYSNVHMLYKIICFILLLLLIINIIFNCLLTMGECISCIPFWNHNTNSLHTI